AIVSVSSKIIAEYYSTPVSSSMGGNEVQANIIENIMHTNFITRIDATPGIDMLTLFGLGILFAFILPRVILLYRFIILMVCFFMLANLNFVLFNFYKILAQPLYIGLELFLLLLASPLLDNEFLSNLSIFKGKFESSGTTKLPKIDLEHEQPRQINTPIKPKSAPRPHQTNAEFENTVAAEQLNDKEINQTIKSDTSDTVASVPNEPTSIEHSPVTMDSGDNEVAGQSKSVQDNAHPEEQPESFTPSASDSQLINKSLGRYKVLDTLGQGAMGTVYKGIDPAINRNVALKTIRLDFVSDPAEMNELKERLFREARAAGMLSHTNIVTIYDVGNENNLQYIAMEYLEGQTLEDMIRRKVKFNYRIITQIITQICSALDYAHSQGIVHRDIKPANIMILKDYVVKVMDFGIARIDSTSMTRTGIAMGTPNYISPEQLQGKAVDSR
ncbi:MAG: protein kinase, partial [candidate division Zixibacteria bacterium]|nr:protein kinase [candidate division Zixibacteria bacterium]